MNRVFFTLALLSPLLGWAGTATAVSVEPEIHSATIGIGGYARRGHRSVLSVDYVCPFESKPVRKFSLLTTDSDGVPVEFVQEVELVSPQTVLKYGVNIPFRVGPPRAPLVLRSTHIDGAIYDTPLDEAKLAKVVPSTTELIGTIGPAIGLEVGLKTLERSSEETVVFPISDDDMYLLESDPTAVDTIVFTRNPPISKAKSDELKQEFNVGTIHNLFDSIKESAHNNAVQKLKNWTARGGRLIVVTGTNPDDVFAERYALQDLLPGQYLGVDRLRSTTGLQAFSGAELKFEGEPPLLANVAIPKKLAVLFESGNAADERPLAAENMYGFGRVTWIFFDLNDRRFEDWSGKGRFLARLISGQEGKFGDKENSVRGGQASHLGYRDLAGQLRAALDQYAGVSPIHFYPVIGLLLIYLLIIGPGEYFFLRRFAPGAMHLTWFLSPLVIGAVAYGFVALGNALRGPEAIVNEAMICDVQSETGIVRGWVWSAVYSPRSTIISMERSGGLAENLSAQWSWQTLPGEGLGGVDTPAIGSAPRAPYRVEQGEKADDFGVTNVPVAQAGSKLFAGTFSSGTASAFKIEGEPSRLRTGKISDLQGTFRNVLPVRLKNAYLAYGSNMYRAYDDIAPGETVAINRLKPKHLEYQLTRREVSNNSDFNQPWDEESTEIPRILEMMMFHRAVGGASYTVLSHKFAPRIDLSFAPAHGYAVLVGVSDEPPLEIAYHAGESELAASRVKRHTVYRVLYRVELGSPSDMNSNGKDQP